jgi:two-component system, chemotaxis family, sensor kinase CheA
MDISHLKKIFVDEANDLLSGLENDLLVLETQPDNKLHIDQVFRRMHTIKGASGIYGFEKISEITHHLETLYDLVREKKLMVTKSLINLTFSVNDHIRNLLTDEKLSQKENQENHTNLLNALTQFQNIEPITDKKQEIKNTLIKKTGIETWQVLVYPDENIIFRGINLSIIIGDLYSLGKCVIHSNQEQDELTFWSIFIVTDKGKDAIMDILMFIDDHCKLNKIADFDIFDEQELIKKNQELNDWEVEYHRSSEIKNQSSSYLVNPSTTENIIIKKNIIQTSNRINVDATKLDTLMYLVTELVTTKSELLLSIQKQSDTKIFEAAEKIEKLSKLFSENALSIRLVSLQEMLVKYQRLVRDLSDQLGKKVLFSIKGEDTELDKNIVDIIAEPIMHLIRNCIDHGLEQPSVRKEKGKDETGTIFFNAFKSGNNVYIEVGDDGTGIDTEYIYKKAIDQNFIQPGIQLNEKEILDLIFLPGFSTAKSLTEVSGRGVGMDIVRKKIQEIRGEVLVESTWRKGTTFTIKLQQTISIIDTLLIKSDSSIFAIPIEDVESCDLEEHDNIFKRNTNLIEYKEELIPYIYLREKFSSISEIPEKEKIIFIRKQNKKYAIIADEIIGQHQAVIKPLNKTFENINFLSGASILGDGSITLLIDTDKLKEQIINTI